jgi:hypothetical protein
MASAAEQLAANLNLGVLTKATELKQRIWFTLGALLVYRLGTYVPVPGVDASVMGEMLAQHGGGILGMFDMFTGGALGRMTVFALNIMPYISASIIVQLMSAAVPSLETLKKEGESGRKKLNQYTRYLTVLIALFQAWGIAIGLESMRGSFSAAVADPGWFFRISCVITLVGGAFGVWWAWPVFWVLPQATWFPVITRLRNIAEHACIARGEPDPLRQARTTRAGWIARSVLAPYWVNYHCEHHMFMHLPCYNLHKAHRLLASKGMLDRMLYEPGGYPVVLDRATGRRQTPAAAASAT